MNIKMQCCGLILLLVLFYFYICRKKIKLHTAQAFTRIFGIAVLNLVLDITSIILLEYHIIVPEILLDAVCKAYISSLILIGMSAFLYICRVLGKRAILLPRYSSRKHGCSRF